MPLIHSKSEPAFKENVRTLMHEVGESPHVQSRKQALAIAYETKRRGKAAGGSVFEGPIVSEVPGRTDHHPMDVGAGSYVLPAEFVSHLGENNTLAGLKHLKEIGPHGIRAMARKAPGAHQIIRKHMVKRAVGGAAGDANIGHPVPIAAAGGEHVMNHDEVNIVGDGDVGLGHKLLDNLVMNQRKNHISTLQKLDPPAQD